MSNYFFDTQVDGVVSRGDEAITFSSRSAVEAEAVRALVDLANDHLRSGAKELIVTALSTLREPLFEAKLSLAVRQIRGSES